MHVINLCINVFDKMYVCTIIVYNNNYYFIHIKYTLFKMKLLEQALYIYIMIYNMNETMVVSACMSSANIHK